MDKPESKPATKPMVKSGYTPAPLHPAVDKTAVHAAENFDPDRGRFIQDGDYPEDYKSDKMNEPKQEPTTALSKIGGAVSSAYDRFDKAAGNALEDIGEATGLFR